MITTVEGAIEQILKSAVPVTELVGTMIYSNIADQQIEEAEAPYMVIITDEVTDIQTQDGVTVSDMMIYIDVYHQNLNRASTITGAVKGALQDYSGTHGTIEIEEMWMSDKMMARSETVDKQIYRMEWMAMVNYISNNDN